VKGLPDYAISLRRLFAWHLLSNQDVARLLGCTEASVSNWTTGKREPGAKYLKAIGDLFEVNPSKLFGDTAIFGDTISNSKRVETAEENIARLRRSRLESV
jgi:transcriptional regulator with XRE-family HTH domain